MEIKEQQAVDSLVGIIESRLPEAAQKTWRARFDADASSTQTMVDGVLTKLRYRPVQPWDVRLTSEFAKACQDLILIDHSIVSIDNGKVQSPGPTSYSRLVDVRLLLADAVANELKIKPCSSDLRETYIDIAAHRLAHGAGTGVPARRQ